MTPSRIRREQATQQWWEEWGKQFKWELLGWEGRAKALFLIPAEYYISEQRVTVGYTMKLTIDEAMNKSK
jgi:hypothetical protein